MDYYQINVNVTIHFKSSDFDLSLTKSHLNIFSLSGVSLLLADEPEVDIEDLPLKFEDIVDKKTYDKMRPPKPGG